MLDIQQIFFSWYQFQFKRISLLMRGSSLRWLSKPHPLLDVSPSPCVRRHNPVIKMQKYSESDERGEFEMTQLACVREGGVCSTAAPSLGTRVSGIQMHRTDILMIAMISNLISFNS